MNRVLRRPMFRLGGSAEGITSGLDGPNINASRQGYSFGGKTLQQMGVSQEFINSNSHLDDKGIFRKWRMENREILPSGEDITIDESLTETVDDGKATGIMQRPTAMTKEEILAQKGILKEVMGEDPEKEAMAPGSVSSMLTNFALNLAAQPGGNLMGAIGKAGAPALEKFQQARQLERLKGRKDDRDLTLEAYRTAAGLKEKEWEAYEEAMGKDPEKGRDPYASEVEIQELETRISDTQTKSKRNTDIDKEIEQIEANPQMDESEKRKQIAELQKEKDSNTADITINQSIIEKISGRDPRIAILEKGIIDEFGIYSKEHLDFMKKHGLTKEAKASGGRVGLAMGGQPEPIMEEMVEQVEETGSDQVADLTYNELRARLPQEISNDIVSLLSNSKSALVDFANIITQQDVDNFNQLYNVDLVLPQEG